MNEDRQSCSWMNSDERRMRREMTRNSNLHRCTVLTLVLVARGEYPLEPGDEPGEGVSGHQLLVAPLLLRAELLHDGPLRLAPLEVPRVPGQLHPLVAPVLVRLDEGRPLDHAAQLPPTGGLRLKCEGEKRHCYA